MFNRIAASLLCLMFIILQTACKPEAFTRTEYALGTIITVTVFDCSASAERAADLAFGRLFDIEKIMSAKFPESELSYVNGNAFKEETAVSGELFSLLETGLEFSVLTKGAFDITLGRLVELWGIGTKNERLPSEAEIEEAKSLCGYEYLLLDNGKKTVKFLKDIKLDLGAIAKGYAADEMKRIMEENGVTEAILNLGGNIALIGNNFGSGYRVGLTDPRNKGKLCGTLRLSDTCAVTSGDYERYFIDGDTGKRYHHIFNRETGYPSENGNISVTVISKSSVTADILSTACFVSGTDKYLDLIDGAVFINENGEITITEGLKNYFEE